MHLIRGNVEKVAEEKEQIEKLKKEGFKEITNTEKKISESSCSTETMSLDQMRKIAKEKEIKGAQSLTKEELSEVLKGVI